MRTDKTAVSGAAEASIDRWYRARGRERDPDEHPLAVDPRMNVDYMSGVSLSGHERNHLFVSESAKRFFECSGISGIDHPADGRALAWLDYDRDGWLDLAVVNANRPLFLLYRNRIGELAPREGHMIALRLVGRNDEPEPQPEASPRDGYGALVEVDVDGHTLLRELRAGEGFAAQNSATLPIGIGTAEQVDALRVRWPSGRVQTLDGVQAGSLVTVYEDAAESADGSGRRIEPYVARGAPPRRARRRPERLPLAKAALRDRATSAVLVFTSMATWCESCKKELPHLAKLRNMFEHDELQLFGVPVDPKDDRDKLSAYVAEHEPSYVLLDRLPRAHVGAFEATVRRELRKSGLPASIVTDASGEILDVVWGAPSLSHIRKARASVD